MSQTTRPVGSAPEPYDGKSENATTFWHILDNYYTMNSVVFTNESKRIAAALTHFKHGTPAGEWASDQMEHALSQNPMDYGTWANFKTTFKDHFIPPQTQMEAMQKMHIYAMGNQDFNKWYQVWSTYATSSNPDINTVEKRPPFKKQGCLSPQERKHRMDKNLCLYCGEASHKAINCTKPPNRRPGGSLRNMETIHEEEKEAIYPTEDTAIGLVSINSLAPLDYIKDATEAR